MSLERTGRGGRILVYRRSLDARSGAGQLVLMQADGLRAAGYRVALAAQRGRLRFFLRTRRWPRRLPDVSIKQASVPVIVDHSCELAGAGIVFVHNLYSAAAVHVPRDDWAPVIEAEANFFSRINRDTPIVANSQLIKAALIAQHALKPERVTVIYPGYCSRRFDPASRPRLRKRARAALGIEEDRPLIGLIASGNLWARGLDIFLQAATLIGRALPRARFLVVGSKRLPQYARNHSLQRDRRLIYRPKSGAPQRWMAALDVCLHTSRFDEYGMIVAESLALGVPAVTSLRCGVAERLQDRYRANVLEHPDPGAFSDAAVAILSDAAWRDELIQAGMRLVAESTNLHYGSQSAELIGRVIGSEPPAQKE